MPAFLIPLHEFNACHTPEGPEGGQFCSSKTGAHVVPAGSASLPALAQMGLPNGRGYTRRFLFNPQTKAMLVGGAMGVAGREQSHAEAHGNARQGAVPSDRLASDYDLFTVHGHLLADVPDSPLIGTAFEKGPLTLQIDRVAEDRRAENAEVAQLDALHAFVAWAAAHGATGETKLYSRVVGMVHAGTPLRKVFPSLFKKTRAPRKRAA
jgi:hypothetical protein